MQPGKTCCFTGHRPNRLPWGEDESRALCIGCKSLLAQEVERSWQDGYRTFLCGMAQGTDLYFAEAVLAAQMVHSDILLVACIPCETQTRGWSRDQIQRYRHILDFIGEEHQILVQREWSRFCMLRRDEYMVDRSQRIIAVYDGDSPGGTRYTLGYAMKKKLESIVIDPYMLTIQR